MDADQGYAVQRERMRTLSRALEKANRASKPIIISRLPGSASSQDSAATHCLTGDPALLLALQPKVDTRAHTACGFSVSGSALTADITLALEVPCCRTAWASNAACH